MLKVIHVCGCNLFAEEFDLRTVVEDDSCEDYYVDVQAGQKVWMKIECNELVTPELKPITDINKPIEYLSHPSLKTCNLIQQLSTSTFEESVKRPRGRPKKSVADTENTVEAPKKAVVKKNVIELVKDDEVKVASAVKKVVTKVTSVQVLSPLKKVVKKTSNT